VPNHSVILLSSLHQKTNATRTRLLLGSPPKALVVQLKRWETHTALNQKGELECTTTKIRNLVECPLEGLSLQEYMISHQQGGDAQASTSIIYRLTAALIHEGDSAQGGHYYAHVKRKTPEGNDEWSCANDASVRRIDAKCVVPANAYLLFYERELQPSAPSPPPQRMDTTGGDGGGAIQQGRSEVVGGAAAAAAALSTGFGAAAGHGPFSSAAAQSPPAASLAVQHAPRGVGATTTGDSSHDVEWPPLRAHPSASRRVTTTGGGVCGGDGGLDGGAGGAIQEGRAEVVWGASPPAHDDNAAGKAAEEFWRGLALSAAEAKKEAGKAAEELRQGLALSAAEAKEEAGKAAEELRRGLALSAAEAEKEAGRAAEDLRRGLALSADFGAAGVTSSRYAMLTFQLSTPPPPPNTHPPTSPNHP
jgi:hypothetical protein